MAAADTDLVAFVDSDCRPPDGWLDTLVPYFDDPSVAAVAPRIVPDIAAEATGIFARYEAVRSSLDMGPGRGTGPSGREGRLRPHRDPRRPQIRHAEGAVRRKHAAG
ncbi:glycosyltransferase [Yinghuangia aomiensis]